MTGLVGLSLKPSMVKMGFSHHWVKLIMFCVKYVSFSLLINGELKGSIYSLSRPQAGGSSFPIFVLILL